MAYGTYRPSNVIQMHQEPDQIEIWLSFDVPAHRRTASIELLESARLIAEQAVINAYGAAFNRMGIKFVGSAIEDD